MKRGDGTKEKETFRGIIGELYRGKEETESKYAGVDPVALHEFREGTGEEGPPALKIALA